MKKFARTVYQATVPLRLRNVIRCAPLLSRCVRWFAADTKMHDLYYTSESYDIELLWLEKASPRMAAEMHRLFSPASVIDVGCGQGAYLAELAKLGLEAHGVELSDAGIARCRAKKLDVTKFDLTVEPSLPWKADVVYSFEVAEHLLPKYADHFVELITSSALKWAVVTAAEPGQPGLNHFNCQPKDYWIALFRRHGFLYEEAITQAWEKRNLDAELPPWFTRCLMVFRRAENLTGVTADTVDRVCK